MPGRWLRFTQVIENGIAGPMPLLDVFAEPIEALAQVFSIREDP